MQKTWGRTLMFLFQSPFCECIHALVHWLQGCFSRPHTLGSQDKLFLYFALCFADR
jgi:hypothetical protein